MNGSTYRFRVYSPPKAVLMLALTLVLCFAMLHLMDTYGYAWMKGRELRLFLLLIPVVALYIWFGKLSTQEVQVKIDTNGFWLDNYPRWGWGRYDHLRIGWLELESWTWEKAKFDGHSISWDRLSFRLTDRRKLLLLPTDDFDPIMSDLPYVKGLEGNFPAFLADLEAAIEAYNNRLSTLNPIRHGASVRSTLTWAWIEAVFSLTFGLLSVFGAYLIIAKSQESIWLMLGCALLPLAFGFQFWKRVQIIRNSSTK